jgi:DNA-binding IclR family transcriptional regulator
MPQNFKRVPAIDKCFTILTLIAETKRPFGYNEMVNVLGLNKSTVFNILHTLDSLGVLEKGPDGLFRLGPRLFVLGNAAAGGSELIKTVHPYLETINNDFKLSSFFGILSGKEVVILDKADRAQGIKISTEIGMRLPVFAGVAGKALLSQLPETEIDKILQDSVPKRFTSKSIVDKDALKKEIALVKETGIAYDREEYIEGLVAVAVPFRTYREDLQAAIWAVGLKQEFRKNVMAKITDYFLVIAKEISCRFAMVAGPSSQLRENMSEKNGLTVSVTERPL